MKNRSWILTACLLALAPHQATAQDGRAKPLFDALDGPGFSSAGGLWYKNNFEQDAGSMNFQAPLGPKGAPVLQLSVREHCPADLRGCSERAEIWEREDLLLPYEAPVWYGFSMKLLDPIPQDNHRYVMAQWKRTILPGAERDYSPFLALRMRSGKLFITVETDEVTVSQAGSACSGKQAQATNRDDSGQTRSLVAVEEGSVLADIPGYTSCAAAIEVVPRGGALPKASAGWVDFVFGVKTGAAGGGRIEIFANDTWVASVKGNIGHQGKGLGPHQYFKFGPYRAAHAGSWSVAYSQFRRGATCADMGRSLICQAMQADPLQ